MAAKTCEESVFQGCNYGAYTGQYPSIQDCIYIETVKQCGEKKVEDADTDGDRSTQIKSNEEEISVLKTRIARNKLIIAGVLLVVVGYFIIEDVRHKA
jgi:hypothetical protein